MFICYCEDVISHSVISRAITDCNEYDTPYPCFVRRNKTNHNKSVDLKTGETQTFSIWIRIFKKKKHSS